MSEDLVKRLRKRAIYDREIQANNEVVAAALRGQRLLFDQDVRSASNTYAVRLCLDYERYAKNDAALAADWDSAADAIEQLERELSISRMAQVVMDNGAEALMADNARLREALTVDPWGLGWRKWQEHAATALNLKPREEVMPDDARTSRPAHDIGPGDQAVAGAAPGPFRVDPEDWTEDYAHENGNYMCSCFNCKKQFFGYKRRIVCRVCAKPDPVSAEDFETEIIDSWIKRNEPAVPLVSADAILHGLGLMRDGKHVPLENFYTKPEPWNPVTSPGMTDLMVDPDLMREDRDARSELDREYGNE